MCDRRFQVKIKIAQKQLGIADEDYRDLLYRKCRVRSSKSLSNSQAAMMLNYFKSLGWVETKKGPLKYETSPRDLYDSSGAAKRKAEAMWETYHHRRSCPCGDSKGHGRRWLFQKFHISDWAFLDRRSNYDVIEALKAMIGRLDRPGMRGESETKSVHGQFQ